MTDGAKNGDFTSTVAPAALQLGTQRILMKPFTIQSLLAVTSAMLTPRERASDEASQAESLLSRKGVR